MRSLTLDGLDAARQAAAHEGERRLPVASLNPSTLRVMSTTDWFDPVPNADTQLFCDPFRIYAEDATAWSGGHEQLLDCFEDAIALVRQAGRNRQHPAFPKARSVLRFPEPAELCLLRPRHNSRFWFRHWSTGSTSMPLVAI